MISINQVYKYVADENGELIRVIHLDPDQDKAVIVSLSVGVTVPKVIDMNKLQEEIESNVLVKTVDPYLKIVDDKDITEAAIKKRDEDWQIVSHYWNTNIQELLDKNTRGSIYDKIGLTHGKPTITIKRLFSRFWQRGMTKNALLPDYANSGGRGKEKKLAAAKIGRPKKADYDGNVATGINITDDIKKLFQVAINKNYRTKNQISLKETYNYLLKDFFSDKYKDKDGMIRHQVWDKSRIPTYDQFYYWFKKTENPQKDISLRESKKELDLNYRPILSNSTLETDGPGTRFQIDATVADIYLVSALDRNRIIGRPVIYGIIDVFSRLVTGIYVGLEGPSWVGAMMTLDNMMADKVEFCRRHGIDITEEQWPSHHLPEIIIADRGEFEGYSPENLINNMGVRIENTSPYRGDLKGIVERSFRTVNTKIKFKAPGAIMKEFRQRGDRDYRLDATLTLEEFTKIYIHMVVHHNNTMIDKYPMAKEMIPDKLVPIPAKLWDWGIANKKGRLKTIDREIFRLNILPKGHASISRAGIKFEKLFYSSPRAVEEQWFIKTKTRNIEIVYDPRNINNIYILENDGRSYEKCYLLEQSIQYKDYALEEVVFAFQLLDELKEKEKNETNQLNVNLDTEIENIVKKAKSEKGKSTTSSDSKSKQLKGIRNNRMAEKDLNRASESFVIGEKSSKEKNKTAVLSLPSKDKKESQEATSKDKLLDKLRKKRDEKREK